jgi:DNA-binding MarR family transcriptional regulator
MDSTETELEKDGSLRRLAGLDRIIHEPGRLILMALLSQMDSADFLFLMVQTGLSWGNLSSHMSRLEAAGYIRVEKDYVQNKPHTVLQLTARGRAAFRSYRQTLRQLLDGLPED